MNEPNVNARKPRGPNTGYTPKKNNREASHQEIAEVFGLTRMRIGQIERAVLAKIRKKLLEHAPHIS